MHGRCPRLLRAHHQSLPRVRHTPKPIARHMLSQTQHHPTTTDPLNPPTDPQRSHRPLRQRLLGRHRLMACRRRPIITCIGRCRMEAGPCRGGKMECKKLMLAHFFALSWAQSVGIFLSPCIALFIIPSRCLKHYVTALLRLFIIVTPSFH